MTALRVHIHSAARRLLEVEAAATLDEARLEAELLYAEAAGVDRAHVLAAGTEEPDAPVLHKFEALLARRLGHEPLAYILGRRECYGMTFEVGRGVLIPRPETETLIEATLAAIRDHPRARRLVTVADVGTGSGVVALAVARHAPSTRVYALDSSTEALAIAGRNRRRFALEDRATLLFSNMLESLAEPVEIVTANLPYVPTAEVDALAPEVRDWEPRTALDGGPDGLDVIKALIEQLPGHLAEGPRAVLIEVGFGQAETVGGLLSKALDASARTHSDLAGIERVVEVRTDYL
jgi:release factor glutamine methyltransferase